MKLGLNLINFGPVAAPENFLKWAGWAEGLNYDFLMVSDHVAVTPDVRSRFPAPLYEPLTLLGWLASATSRIEIGASVIILPYRHPLEVAKAVAGIDRLSGGRVIMGVGVGWAKQEYEVLGVPFNKRGAIADEALGVLHACWDSEVATFQGQHFAFDDLHTAPLPARKPPIWVGGGSDAGMRRAVRFGDAWHPYNKPATMLADEALPRLKEIAAEEGKAVPALTPRITIDATASDAVDTGWDEIRRMQDLGATHILIDTAVEDPGAGNDLAAAERLFEALAAKR